ncbi:hypothetical protein [Polyangium jinanense]|uniref:Uncharacterized protein n=1 Tax=Polyangium jinanense TaxID=2829994 RepID=A0A9X4AYB0_9BACT|nr:hypothetical protein [Polyangium jinanense]MDC3962654.1 hypothetical protein [Polyangium jinanense]MDC3989374.1 hypothetical protein [Polyangium jinanense]
MSQRTLAINLQYPEDPREIRESYTNYIAVNAVGEEIILDICQLQPQSIRSHEDRQMIDALVQQRLTMTRDHATRLVQVLLRTLKAAEGLGVVLGLPQSGDDATPTE